jgi:protein tyrosine/serine phosphatase
MNKTLAVVGIGLFACLSIGVLADATNSAQSNSLPVSAGASAWQHTTAPTHPMKKSGVPNFGKLNDYLWRSGQPTKEGYSQLASEGLKTVVNLRAEFPQDKDLLPDGVRYVYIPIKDGHAPTVEQGNEFIATVSDPANWPVLVHCHAGEGRAGAMSAIARHSFDGWDKDAIMSEVHNYFGGSHMGSGQQDFISNWMDTPAVAVHIAITDTKKAVDASMPSKS